MKILQLYTQNQKTDENADTPPQAIILFFGVGLLGGAIYQALIQQGYQRQLENVNFSWASDSEQLRNADKIYKQVNNILSQDPHPDVKISIIWSAGVCGFLSSQNETDLEMNSFRTVVMLAEKFARLTSPEKISFHLLSSSGGLYEGCSYVDCSTKPIPLRAYGRLKLNQEKLLQNSALTNLFIYRPSTVYGPIRQGIRMGLVPTLIKNTILRKTTQIFGNLSTLRDYVYHKDIAAFVARNLTTSIQSNLVIYHLISGKSTSIFEILRVVQKISRQHILYKLQYDPENACDMKFSPTLFPENWSPVSFYIGCKSIYQQWLNDGTCGVD